MADRMAVITGNEIFRVFFCIHIDRAERVRTADVKDENALQVRKLDYFEPVRRNEFAWAAGRLAPGMRFELQGPGMPFVDQGSRPILKRNIFDVGPCVKGGTCFVPLRIDHKPAVALPAAGFSGNGPEVDVAVCEPWCRTRRRLWCCAALSLAAPSDLLSECR